MIPEDEYVPILIDSKGIQLHYQTPPSVYLNVKPSTSDSSDDRCFVFWPDNFPSISTEPVISSKSPQKPEKPNQKLSPSFKNFGASKFKQVPFKSALIYF